MTAYDKRADDGRKFVFGQPDELALFGIDNGKSVGFIPMTFREVEKQLKSADSGHVLFEIRRVCARDIQRLKRAARRG